MFYVEQDIRCITVFAEVEAFEHELSKPQGQVL